MTEERNKGCEFQSDCIEYKDISYLKIMPICAIHELSIACHDKVNKCKYYKLYKQLKRLEQENKELKEENIEYDEELAIEKLSHKSDLETLERYRSALEEIKNLVKGHKVADEVRLKSVLNKINEVLVNNITNLLDIQEVE